MSPVWLKRVWLLQFPSEHEFVQLPYGREAHLLFSSRYPSVLLPGSSGVGALCAGSTYEQVADWRSVGEPVIKKKQPSRLHCLPSPRHFAEGSTVSIKVKYSLLLLHSHLFAEARTLSFYSNQPSLCYVVIFLKEGASCVVIQLI